MRGQPAEPPAARPCPGDDQPPPEKPVRKLASVQTVNAIEPIPNADAIEKVHVLGRWAVARKGERRPGDRLVYFEIDSLQWLSRVYFTGDTEGQAGVPPSERR